MTGTNAALVPLITDKYTLGELIGTGSFANVYKATQKATNLTVAIKSYKMKKHFTQEMFRASSEMAFVRFLTHANIIKFVSCDTTKSCMYLTMEFADKGTLLKYMPNREKLYSDKLKAVMTQLLSALHYLHSLTILHGDVKPENILVTATYPNMVIKLTDFGLAEILEESHRKTRNSGSYLYMAPELHLNFPYDLTADLYSAGVVMYELIYGQKPIPRKHKSEYVALLRKRMQIKFPPMDDVSPACMDLLQSLLHYDKHKRPTGQKLLDHSFLRIAHPTYPTEDRYIIGCGNFIKSSNYLKSSNCGQAYIEAVEGFLQLKLYANTIKRDDGLFNYLQQNLEKYSNYISKLEKKISTNEWCITDVDTSIIDERLRCMLVSTPCLLNAYDMCLVGNMYINQNKINIGTRMLEDGLSIILTNMTAEPAGERKNLLLFKISQWVTLLEKIKTNGETCVVSPILDL